MCKCGGDEIDLLLDTGTVVATHLTSVVTHPSSHIRRHTSVVTHLSADISRLTSLVTHPSSRISHLASVADHSTAHSP